MQLLSCIPLMHVHCMFVQYAAICHNRRFVRVSGAPVWVRSGHRKSMLLSVLSINVN
jgi:hypothetical protein